MASLPPTLRPPARVHHPCLDGLRAIAVLLVLYNHGPRLLATTRAEGIWTSSPGAWLGVDLFFVLSGYLITTILLHERGQPGAFRRFWLRRALRIFPLAYGYLAALALVGWLVPGFAHLRVDADYAWAATYLLNFHIAASGWTTAALGILWSLAVEEHFYLAWPWLALRARLRVVGVVLVVLVVGVPLLRWGLVDALGPSGVYVATFTRCDTLAWGALLALAHASPNWPIVQRCLRWLALPAFAFVAFVLLTPIDAVEATTPGWFHVVGYSGVALAGTAACAFAIAPSRAITALLGNRLLGYVGRISYGIYVWHVLTAELTREVLRHLDLGLGLAARAAVWAAVLFVVATASWRWFESPLLRLKDRCR